MASYLERQKLSVLSGFNVSSLRVHIAMQMAMLLTHIKDFTQIDVGWHGKILSWRNNAAIRRWMFTDRSITLEEHRKFVKKLQDDATLFYGLVFSGEEPLGVIDLIAIDTEKENADIGLYARPGAKGAGNLLMGALLKEAFAKRALKKLRAEVFTENKRAIALYRRFGFKEKGTKEHKKGKLLNMELVL